MPERGTAHDSNVLPELFFVHHLAQPSRSRLKHIDEHRVVRPRHERRLSNLQIPSIPFAWVLFRMMFVVLHGQNEVDRRVRAEVWWWCGVVRLAAQGRLDVSRGHVVVAPHLDVPLAE